MKNVHLNIDHALDHVVARVYHNGIEAKPRGMKVLELLAQSVSFNMEFPLVTRRARNLGYRFAPAEAAWILSGDNRLETIKRYSPFIWEFSDDGFFYSGAYGPRVVDQLTYVCDVLADDPDTRQAVIEVWRPNPRAGRDIPCTLTYQFVLRDGRLNCVQSMRSSDAWLGYAYDAFNASMLTGYVMLLLRDRAKRGLKDLKIGYHTMFVGSQHLYERNFEDAKRYLDDQASLFKTRAFDPYEFDKPQDLIDHLWLLAERSWTKLDDDAYLVDQLKNVHLASEAKT